MKRRLYAVEVVVSVVVRHSIQVSLTAPTDVHYLRQPANHKSIVYGLLESSELPELTLRTAFRYFSVVRRVFVN